MLRVDLVSAAIAIAIFAGAGAAQAEPVFGGQVRPVASNPATDAKTISGCLAGAGNLAPACIGIVANACLKAADSTQRIGDCETRELKVWDGWLNRDYAVVMARLSPAVRTSLRDVERGFVADMDKRCGFYAVLNGPTTVNRPSEQECRLRATAVQWLWLRDFIGAS